MIHLITLKYQYDDDYYQYHVFFFNYFFLTSEHFLKKKEDEGVDTDLNPEAKILTKKTSQILLKVGSPY